MFGLHCLHACVDCLLQRPLAANQPERGTIWQSAAWLRPAAHLVTAGYASEARATQTTISFILPVVRSDSFARPYCHCWKKASTAMSLRRFDSDYSLLEEASWAGAAKLKALNGLAKEPRSRF